MAGNIRAKGKPLGKMERKSLPGFERGLVDVEGSAKLGRILRDISPKSVEAAPVGVKSPEKIRTIVNALLDHASSAESAAFRDYNPIASGSVSKLKTHQFVKIGEATEDILFPKDTRNKTTADRFKSSPLIGKSEKELTEIVNNMSRKDFDSLASLLPGEPMGATSAQPLTVKEFIRDQQRKITPFEQAQPSRPRRFGMITANIRGLADEAEIALRPGGANPQAKGTSVFSKFKGLFKRRKTSQSNAPRSTGQ